MGQNGEQDWSAYQPGSFETLSTAPNGVPYRVIFETASEAIGGFVFHIDAIVRYGRPAVPELRLNINGHEGSYRLKPEPAPELTWSSGAGTPQYVGYVSLDLLLPAEYLQCGVNTLELRYMDGFGLYYDDLSLRYEPGQVTAAITGVELEPSIFFKQRQSGLKEIAEITVRTTRPISGANVQLTIGASVFRLKFSSDKLGDFTERIEVPAPDQVVSWSANIIGMEGADFHGTFQPKRRWRLYSMPLEQASFGYVDTAARTPEWEDRYIDKVLEILPKYPDYSFSLDAAANLESYLRNRNEAHGNNLVKHLQTGKMGINALYLNFFTGLASSEEIFRMLEYSLETGKQRGFPVDSASQTDEPSVAWALPQILAGSGIKYLSVGSDPTRAPINSQGLLNFRSPFYWQAADGSKVLLWSAVGYVATNDLMWGGWNPDDARSGGYTPSIFGLEHSLPLFLSQYERKDYAPDAVFLYGLHNDEEPIVHDGYAGILKHWKEEYAFPKVIAGTQRDFFRYLSDRFGNKIEILRGDAGAYWEDEAGADARVAALNRASQVRLVGAEIFGSIAQWLTPALTFDEAPFRVAWKNIMLTDAYVWSAADSFREPDSEQTRSQEFTHRGYAEDASRQSTDLLTVSADRIAELIKTNSPGAVVFNQDSQPRDGFFDYELDPDEELHDPANGKALPCGSIQTHDFNHGYHDVRCWARQVPAIGYNSTRSSKDEFPARSNSVRIALDG